MAQIIWTKKAKQQLRSAVKYISKSSGEYYAKIVLEGIFKEIDWLENFPQIGQKEPLLIFKKSEYRYLVKWSYKIIYRVTSDMQKVYISRIFHTSQNPNKILKYK